jgi:uncharacterized protein
MKLSTYCKIYPSGDDPDSRILFLTKNAAKIQAPASLIDDIEKQQLSEEEMTDLREMGFLVDDAEAEKAEMLGFMERLNSMNKLFHAKVVMNLDCNLACIYCFEGTRKGKLYMAQETGDLLVEFIKKKVLPHKEEISLTFYGGEPLLSSGFIRRIAEQLKTLADAAGVKFSFALITNGTLLTPRVVDELKPLGLRLASVTLDGPGEVHDKYRPFTSGKGSFDTIFRNLKDVCDTISIQIGGNYTEGNYREFPRLLDYLIENGLTPERISDVQFDPVNNESEEFALPDFREGCASLNEPWLMEACVYLKEEILRRGYRTRRVTPITCMMEMRDSFVINYNGDIYKCAGLIGREEFCVGNVASGVRDYRQSHHLDNWKNERCLACAYLPICFGGCRYMKLIRDGNMDGIDCNKKHFDTVIGPLVMQDIRYGVNRT